MDSLERAAAIRRLRRQGETLKAIGANFGISQSRVSQILAKPPAAALLPDTAVRRLFIHVDCLDLTIRLRNLLKREWFYRLGDIVTQPKATLRGTEGMSTSMLAELVALTSTHGLRLGLRIPGWPSSTRRQRELTYRIWDDIAADEDLVELLDTDRLRLLLGLPNLVADDLHGRGHAGWDGARG
jgi:hypothetical protein